MQANFPLVKKGFMDKARTLTDFFKHEYQVTENDADINKGAKYYLITKPGSAPINFAPPPNTTKKIYWVQWNIVFDLQVRYKSYKESWSEFEVLRDAVLNLYVFTLDKTLPGVKMIKDITITAPAPPGQKPPEGTPSWYGQQLTAVITQEINQSV